MSKNKRRVIISVQYLSRKGTIVEMATAQIPDTGATSSTDNSFEVEKILSHKLTSKTECKFKVKWKGWKVKDSTLEPLENLMTVPLLLQDYVEKFEKKSRTAASGSTTESNRAFSVIPKEFTNQWKLEDEFIPQGTEHVGKIKTEFERGLEGLFWLVKFMEMPTTYVFVRKCAMIYYFPLESLTFLKKKEKA